ncbi:MAG TPA: DUF3426 domain-containing protein [Methylotenera sp.]|jgi:predicted Zn finger-like uncharacterized protein
MRVITHCPACQTQFFATEEQLNQHGGKVRCGQCMQVFDAREQLISVAEDTADTADSSSLNDNTSSIVDAPATQAVTAAESPKDFSEIAGADSTADTAEQQPSFLGDAIKKNKNRSNQITNKSSTWLWAFATLIMVLIAGLQSIYFLRDEIAIYYPNAKSYLVQACQKLSCSINLPQNIEFIVIDDSDMQEDAEHPGLVRFASTLINNGTHVVAYPNLELTLTDVEDKPVLRRIFKANEYLPAGTNIADGIQAGTETRIKLAVTTNDVAVAGYRVFVTY